MNDAPNEKRTERMPELLREVLLFETSYRLSAGETKAETIKTRFGFSAFTYRRLLKQALEHPAADSVASAAVRKKWDSSSRDT